MDSASVINSSTTRSSFCYPIERQEEIDASFSVYTRTTQLSDATKVNTVGYSLSIDSQRRRNSSHDDLYSKLPDAEELEPVAESQARQVLAKIHHEMHEFKNLFNQNDQTANNSSERFNNLDGKSFQYIVYLIQDLFSDIYQEAIKKYAEASEVLSETFKARIKAREEKEQERLEQIKEQKAKVYKSGAISVGVDWVSAAVTLGLAAAGGPATLIWVGTGLIMAGKAWFEGAALQQRAAGNDKEAEESERVAQILGVIEFAAVFTALGIESMQVVAKTVAKHTAVVDKITNEFGGVPLRNLCKQEQQNFTRIAQRAFESEEIKVELKVLEQLKPPLWESYEGLMPLVKDGVLSQWKAAKYMQSLFLALQSFNMASNGIRKAITAQYESTIQTLGQEVALQRFAQNIIHQLMKENLENIQLASKKPIEMAKASQLWHAKLTEILRLASDSIAINA